LAFHGSFTLTFVREDSGVVWMEMTNPETGKSETRMLEEESQAFIATLESPGVIVYRPAGIDSVSVDYDRLEGGAVMDAERTPLEMSEEDKTALSLLQHFCYTVGSANDAEDHGYGGEARRMREESCESIRNLVDQTPFLLEHFPGLKEELDTFRFQAFGWSSVAHEAEALLAGDVL
jgi:hypothetical protein